MTDMRDLIPWSLFYGELNKCHLRELEAKDVMIGKLRDQILKNLLGTCCGAEDPKSGFWDDVSLIRDFTTAADVERVGTELKNKNRERFPLTWVDFEPLTNKYMDIIKHYLWIMSS